MQKTISLVGGLCAALAVGCSASDSVDDLSTSTIDQAIVFGNTTKDPALAAVGGVVVKFARYRYQDVTCTGTLVAPQVVLTARHCVDGGLFGTPGLNNFVVFGDNATRPQQKIKIKNFVHAPRGQAGLLGDGGRDVALLYLDKAPTGITPMKLGRFDESMLGQQFRIAGFGRREDNSYGAKVEGLATARALAGDWYRLLFNDDYEAFTEWYWTDASLAWHVEGEADYWWALGSFQLEPEFELLAGGLPGESVGCFGDSGGPLFLGTTAGDMTLYGVDFAGEGSYATTCALGGGYTVMNDEILEFVQAAIDAAPYFLGQ